MIPIALDRLQVQDLTQLLTEARSEDRTIEYKLEIPSSADSQKIPWLLKPVCSFANTDGGDLVFGMRAQDGIPQDLVGVEIANLDQLRLTLEHMLQNGIEPQLRGVQIKDIQVANSKYAVVVRVPKSWTSPHRVKSNAKFYARSSAGAYELDVPQLRQAFLLTETVAERIRAFRIDRVFTVSSGSAPVALMEGARSILHLFPLSSFTTSTALPVSQYENLWERLRPPDGGYSIYYHLNFDGIVVASETKDIGFHAYSQLFRSGVIEFVNIYPPYDQQYYIPSKKYERTLIRCFEAGLIVLRDLGFAPPVYVVLTLAGVRGYRLGVDLNLRLSNMGPRPFDRDVLAIPELELGSFELDAAAKLRPLFDYVWNASGYRGSLNYDENGVWRGHS